MPVANGPFGQPRFDNDDDADFATDLTAVSNFAANVADREIDTILNRDAISPKWPGMNVWVDETNRIYTWTGSGFVSRFQPRTAFNPSWSGTAPNFGTGATLTGFYSVSDQYCDVELTIVYGTASWSFSDPRLVPPVTVASALVPATGGTMICGHVTLTDVSAGAAGRFAGDAAIIDTGTFRWFYEQVSGTLGSQVAPVTTAAPFAAASGDVLTMHARYPID